MGGALGAAAWAVVALFTGYEVGWIAWGLGWLVGYGVAFGNRGVSYSPRATGVLAVAITLLAIPAGKYAGVQLSIPGDDDLVELLLENTRNDEYAVSFLADEVVEELTASGRFLDWPLGVDPSLASTRWEYPEEVWGEAEARWTGMSPNEKDEFRSDVEARSRANIEAHLPEIRAAIGQGAFLGSFGVMDLLFFGLGVVTAFGVAGGKGTAGDGVVEEFGRVVRLAMIQVTLADGEAGEEELAIIQEIYRNLIGLEMSEEELRREVAAVEAGQVEVFRLLAVLGPRLNEQGKGFTIQAAIQVAAADGEFREEEKEVIYRIAASLGVTDEQLQSLLQGIAEESRI